MMVDEKEWSWIVFVHRVEWVNSWWLEEDLHLV